MTWYVQPASALRASLKSKNTGQPNKETATQEQAHLVSKRQTQQQTLAAARPKPKDMAAAAGPQRGVQPGASLGLAARLACTALQHGCCSEAGPGPQHAPSPGCTAPQRCLPQLPVSTTLQPHLGISIDAQGKKDGNTDGASHCTCGLLVALA